MFPLSSLQSCVVTMSLSTVTMMSVYSPFSEVLIHTEDLTIKMINNKNSLAIFATTLKATASLHWESRDMSPLEASEYD